MRPAEPFNVAHEHFLGFLYNAVADKTLNIIVKLLSFFTRKLDQQNQHFSIKVKFSLAGKLPGLVVNVEDSQSEPWSLDVSSIPKN
jgi:hypothetical protein